MSVFFVFQPIYSLFIIKDPPKRNMFFSRFVGRQQLDLIKRVSWMYAGLCWLLWSSTLGL